MLITWLVLRQIRQSRIMRHQTELHMRVIDKFAASQDLAAFLSSDSGKRLLTVRSEGLQTMIVAAAQVGSVLTSLGMGLLIVLLFAREDEFLLGGIISLALGAGFLVASFMAQRHAREWGINPRRDKAM